MALTRLSRSASSIDPLLQLGKLVSELLPHRGLPLGDPLRRWSDRLLVLGALLWCWAGGSSLRDRFGLARACLVEIHPTRKRSGAGYNGFIDCLTRHNLRLLRIVTDTLRRRLIRLAGRRWRTFGFVVFGVDGTKIEAPRSDDNLAHWGVANKKHAGPEMLLCGLFHLATRSLWSFARDIARGSERALLASMLPCLPKNSLVVADAGFVGWNTIQALLEAKHHLLLRAGANVRLLRQLGHAQEHEGIVYLWPDKQQKKSVKPIILRQVLVRDARGREMGLLTSVLETDTLSDAQLIELYRMRWHVEVSYRWLKTSLSGRKMLSLSPTHAGVELDWTMMSLWVLTLLTLAQGVSGDQLSLTEALRAVRETMTRRRGAGGLRGRLWRSRRDGYVRRSNKTKRHYPRRSRLHRCGLPRARLANPTEIQRYQAILAKAA